MAEEHGTKYAAVIVFDERLTKEQAARVLQMLRIKALIEYDPGVNEFDPFFGEPVFYVP